MISLCNKARFPKLLVSVRDSQEARTAQQAGADVIDIKEPSRGSLGAADSATVSSVLQALDGHVPVSVALGELVEQNNCRLPPGVTFFKIGLAGCGHSSDWQSKWHRALQLQQSTDNSPPQSVAVVYADWLAADAPHPDAVLQTAVGIGCSGLLIDTWEKSRGNLFDHWPLEQLQSFLDRARLQLGFVALAGSLAGTTLRQAAELMPDLIAVRGAACDSGRNGSISADRVRQIGHVLREVQHKQN